mmetsp:Transcript_134924/g.219468  ORF Transcript_134924/g.219468 Transcript_134924/m.219468 type:complete len:715 (-) Transcript_134924:81-2225(-)
MALVDVNAAGTAPVEMATWEQDKENVRPERRGRDPAKLAEVALRHKAAELATQDASGKLQSAVNRFDEDRRRERADFEAQIQLVSERVARSQSEDLDTLVQLWWAYARWAVEWFPADSSEERRILERATSQLAAEPRCRDHVRYLGLWLRLADLHKEPQEIFGFLWGRGIGLGHADFYEAWANSLERQRRFNEVEEVIAVGRARAAQPREHLEAFRQAFAARMSGRMRRSAEDVAHGSLEEVVADHPPRGRPTLNPISDAEARQLHRPLMQRPLQPTGLGSTRAGAEVRGTSTMTFGCALSGPWPTDGREIDGRGLFSLEEEAMGAAPGGYRGTGDTTPPRASIFDAQANWLLPPAKEAEAGKENMLEAVPQAWRRGGSRRGQQARARTAQRSGRGAGGGGGSSRSSFAVFVDEELQAEPAVPATPAAQGISPPAQRRRNNFSRAESGIAEVHADAAAQTSPVYMPPVPGAPRRRPRAADDQSTAANDLAASLLGLRLSDQPPAKRARSCLPDHMVGTDIANPDATSGSRSSSDTAMAQDVEIPMVGASNAIANADADGPCTPPRARRSSLRARLFGESSGLRRPEPADYHLAGRGLGDVGSSAPRVAIRGALWSAPRQSSQQGVLSSQSHVRSSTPRRRQPSSGSEGLRIQSSEFTVAEDSPPSASGQLGSGLHLVGGSQDFAGGGLGIGPLGGTGLGGLLRGGGSRLLVFED